MKYILKQEEPQEVIAWKNLANDEWQPSWNVFQNPQKQRLKESLLEEQGFICCYCQQRIEVDSKTEIEHIITREECDELNNEALKLEYTNLIASCEGNKPPSRHPEINESRHCNGFRGNRSLPITPLIPNCEDFFKYNFRGKIKGLNVNAQTTIENLNLEILEKSRESKIQGILPDEIILSITNNDIQILIDYYSRKSNIDNDGKMKFPEYSGVIINLLRQLDGN